MNPNDLKTNYFSILHLLQGMHIQKETGFNFPNFGESPRVGSDHRPGRILDLRILVESQIMVDLVVNQERLCVSIKNSV